ncbi:Prp8 binding protein [Fistulifera solaris]|uniref:Prp8 binding protein n=1 Tax=Fistulifera solaris TaxID=1519565 RepID=A0A1Z5JXU3_FISSO|nr:Prp8 binding protein [Fistulifera solaris]|eukprot:GAX18706.1 Prp8 binding protein [Fistulifera solaris]
MEGPAFEAMPPHKKLRGSEGAIVAYTEAPEIRSSSLPSSTLLLTGHTGSVYALRYSPNGQTLCSTSFDMNCLLWNHQSNEDIPESYHNYNVLSGHKNAVLDCHWCDDETIVTCSADKTVQLWDANTATRLRKWQQHTGIVNACDTASEQSVVSASDDGLCFLWDRRQKSAIGTLASDYPVTAVAADALHVYAAGMENMIYCWDLRQQAKVYGMKGHTDLITCLALHPEGTHLLSNSMDHSLRSWDIRPFVTGKNRHSKTFVGHKHNAEKGLLKCSWSRDGSMVTAGSADKMVHIWDEFSTEELYLLPGHKGCVNTVVFHPHENVIASGASDKQIFVGELS